MTTKIKLGDGDNMGLSLPVITDYNVSIGTGANDFVETATTATGTSTATANAGNIGDSTITFGNGAANLVEVTATQKQLAQAVGVHERAARYWELKDDKQPTSTLSTLGKIEAVLHSHGVIVFATPTAGARFATELPVRG
jgi:hypothetical protein